MAALVSLLSVWLLLLLLPCDLGDEPKPDGCFEVAIALQPAVSGRAGLHGCGRRLRQTQRGWVEQEPGSRGALSSLAEDCRFDAEDLKKEQRAVGCWQLAMASYSRVYMSRVGQDKRRASPLRPQAASFNVDDTDGLRLPVPGDKPGVSPDRVQQGQQRAQLGVIVMEVLGF